MQRQLLCQGNYVCTRMHIYICMYVDCMCVYVHTCIYIKFKDGIVFLLQLLRLFCSLWTRLFSPWPSSVRCSWIVRGTLNSPTGMDLETPQKPQWASLRLLSQDAKNRSWGIVVHKLRAQVLPVMLLDECRNLKQVQI